MNPLYLIGLTTGFPHGARRGSSIGTDHWAYRTQWISWRGEGGGKRVGLGISRRVGNWTIYNRMPRRR